MSKFEEIYKKVLDADKKFKELGIPINLEFKIEDLRDALIESNDKIEELKSINKKLEDAINKVEEREIGTYNDWKKMFETFSPIKKDRDALRKEKSKLIILWYLKNLRICTTSKRTSGEKKNRSHTNE